MQATPRICPARQIAYRQRLPLSHTDVNSGEIGYGGKRVLAENPDNDATSGESEAIWSEKDDPIRLAGGVG